MHSCVVVHFLTYIRVLTKIFGENVTEHGTVSESDGSILDEGLAVASIAHDAVVEMTPHRDDSAW